MNDTAHQNDLELRRQELELQGRKNEDEVRLRLIELEMKRDEIRETLKNENKRLLHSSPIIIAVFSTFFGLIGTGIGAALQGYNATALERHKFEATLIQKALEPENEQERAKKLLFLVNAGLLKQLNESKIREIAQDPSQIPKFSPITAEGTTVREIKELLKNGGYYQGEINDYMDLELLEAIRSFQVTNKLIPDGFVGNQTLHMLRELHKQ
jgi:hypothetical protein